MAQCQELFIEPKGSTVGQGDDIGGPGAKNVLGAAERPILILAGNSNCLACANNSIEIGH